MSPLTTWLSLLGITIYSLSVILLAGFYLHSHARSVLQKRSLLRCKQQSPCGQCIYFTDEVLLPCTVNPKTVLSDEAANCSDFAKRDESFRS